MKKIYMRLKKFIRESMREVEMSLPKLLGHNVESLQQEKKTKKKYPKIIEKSFVYLDQIVNFIFRREGKNKVNEVLKVAWGPLIVGLVVMMLFFGVFGVWAAVAPIDGAVVAIGEVVLSSNRQVIQHLEGGIINEILVKEGELVEKNQSLIYLSDTSARANLGVMSEKMLVLLSTEARLIAIRDSLEQINFPDEIENLSNEYTRNKVRENQERLFASYKKTISGQVDILNQRIKQLNHELVGISAQLESAQKQYQFINEELETKKKLLTDGYISKPYILALERQHADAQGRVGQYEALLAQTKQKIGENELEIINITNSVQGKINDELKETDAAIADLKERLTAVNDVLQRTTVKAPLSGTVTGLKYHTKGGVIAPGAHIMDIVPLDDDLIIDAKIQTRNIEEILTAQKKPEQMVSSGDVKGLKVKVRLSAYSSRRVGLFDGIVTQVSADAFSEPNGMRYYSIQIAIPKSKLPGFKNVQLYPGMPAEVYIITQSRTLLEYLWTPIAASFEKAFKER